LGGRLGRPLINLVNQFSRREPILRKISGLQPIKKISPKHSANSLVNPPTAPNPFRILITKLAYLPHSTRYNRNRDQNRKPRPPSRGFSMPKTEVQT
jgi:hypothetical protein